MDAISVGIYLGVTLFCFVAWSAYTGMREEKPDVEDYVLFATLSFGWGVVLPIVVVCVVAWGVGRGSALVGRRAARALGRLRERRRERRPRVVAEVVGEGPYRSACPTCGRAR